MFFKKKPRELPKTGEIEQHGAQPGTEVEGPIAEGVQVPLGADELRRTVDPATLGFASTADLEPIKGLIGQDRALRAIEFGASMEPHDYNIFVLGPPAAGKSTAVKAFLERKRAEPVPLYDWVYVNNFEDYNKPKALRLPCGRAQAFSKAIVTAIDELRLTVPSTFESDDYQSQRRQIDEGFRAGQEEAFEALNTKAREQNIAILRTPAGIAMAPMHDGKVVKPEVFNGLPEEMRKSVEAKIEALQKELAEILETVPKSDKERREKLAELNATFAEMAVTEALEPVKAAFADLDDAIAYVAAVESDLIRNVGLFLIEDQDQPQIVKQPVDVSRDPRFRRYMVNIMVATGKPAEVCERPLIEELNPTYGNLVGRSEHIAQMGALVTDFLLLKPGALHRANGGFLLIDARKMLLSPFAWEALKRAIKAREIRIEQPVETAGFISTQTMDPEPIPLNVKIILFGDRMLYYLLAANDPDFGRLFKVQADFDDTIPRNGENDQAYAQLIASIVAQHDLKHVDGDGVARLIEEGARLADDREKLSIEIGRLADVVREADYWAAKEGHSRIARADIERAIEEHIQRADRMRDRAQETIEREIIMIATDGEKVGQINGLSVLQLGDFSFGRPSRITARVRMGRGRVTDIEREVKLGGPLHSKGVMILWGFLAGRFAKDVPLAMAASLVFEQSYGGVDGDSASSTELYALLSALSEVPIKQGIAVTGSVNQWGEVQAIGGVNEKIEGYFDVCAARGLTGSQGVMIPKANVQHLMLRPDVVAAAREGRFSIYAASHIDEGIEILTGVKAGVADNSGKYPSDTINFLVERKLHEFASAAKRFDKGEAENNSK
jgi:lon-related putative ATP-dependent protease